MSEVIYRSVKALCPDDKYRAVQVRSLKDTGEPFFLTPFFVPARAVVKKKKVSGFVYETHERIHANPIWAFVPASDGKHASAMGPVTLAGELLTQLRNAERIR